jgi:hypothetical protein
VLLSSGAAHAGKEGRQLKYLVLLSAVLLIGVSGVAVANWYEDFDAYADGTKLYHVGGWTGWDDVESAAGTVTSAQALSAPHSLGVSNSMGSDAVHPFDPALVEGAWTFTAHQYIPSGLDAETYFILNNVYNHGGPYEWAIQMGMNPATGMVTEQIHGGSETPVVYDAWVEIRVEFDLDLDTCDAYYNNVLIASGTWATSSYPTVEFANVDLYAPHNVGVYFDDLSLVPEPASLLLLAIGALALRRR